MPDKIIYTKPESKRKKNIYFEIAQFMLQMSCYFEVIIKFVLTHFYFFYYLFFFAALNFQYFLTKLKIRITMLQSATITLPPYFSCRPAVSVELNSATFKTQAKKFLRSQVPQIQIIFHPFSRQKINLISR